MMRGIPLPEPGCVDLNKCITSEEVVSSIVTLKEGLLQSDFSCTIAQLAEIDNLGGANSECTHRAWVAMCRGRNGDYRDELEGRRYRPITSGNPVRGGRIC